MAGSEISTPQNPTLRYIFVPHKRACVSVPSHRVVYHAGILQQKILRRKGAEIGIPKLGWHTFRHTYRSLIDEAGAPIGVQQKLMRHSNAATTMNVYDNSTLRAKQDANSKVVKILINPERDKDVA